MRTVSTCFNLFQPLVPSLFQLLTNNGPLRRKTCLLLPTHCVFPCTHCPPGSRPVGGDGGGTAGVAGLIQGDEVADPVTSAPVLSTSLQARAISHLNISALKMDSSNNDPG